jgi:tetratricopeptide (TPR) repeat protein
MRSSHLARLRDVALSAVSMFASLVLLLILPAALAAPLQAQSLEQLEVGPPPLHRAEPPAPGATAKELESRGDSLQSDKNYLDAIDYYQAALAKDARNAVLMNKIGMSQLLLRRYKDAMKSFERAIRVDKRYANAYANLAVVYYEQANYGKSIRYYNKAISLDGNEAVFYSNRAASLFVQREYDKASADYAKAFELDPDIFERTARGAGVQARLPSPQDRAHYDYVLAKLYAKNGVPERSLHYLKKAMEEGYKDIRNVYKDEEFSALRKDPRFNELMAAKPVAIPD